MKSRLMVMASFILSLILIFGLSVTEAKQFDKEKQKTTGDCTQTIGAFIVDKVKDKDEKKYKDYKDCAPGALPETKGKDK